MIKRSKLSPKRKLKIQRKLLGTSLMVSSRNGLDDQLPSMAKLHATVGSQSHGKNRMHRIISIGQFYLYDMTNEMYIPLVDAVIDFREGIWRHMPFIWKKNMDQEFSKILKRKSGKSSSTSLIKRK